MPEIIALEGYTIPTFGNERCMPYGNLVITNGVKTQVCTIKDDENGGQYITFCRKRYEVKNYGNLMHPRFQIHDVSKQHLKEMALAKYEIVIKSETPHGIPIQLENRGGDYMIGAYPIAQRDDEYGTVHKGKEFRLSIKTVFPFEDFAQLHSGEKLITDMAGNFWNGERDKYYLGMPSTYKPKTVRHSAF